MVSSNFRFWWRNRAIEIVLEKRAEELDLEKGKEGSKKCLAKELKVVVLLVTC